MQSWNGHGDLNLRDGLIWDIPLFGIFSDVLNGMVPGLGSSRASAGTCTFAITNGIIRSDDLDIRSTGMRLQYRGTLDFQGQVNARVEAELLRDMLARRPGRQHRPVAGDQALRVQSHRHPRRAEGRAGSICPEVRAPALPVALPSPPHVAGAVPGGPRLQPHERAAAQFAQTELNQPEAYPVCQTQ